MVGQANGRDRGLTMVEILVVVAILGILAAIIIPVSDRVKKSAMSTQCLGQLRNLGISLNEYFIENGAQFPEMVAARESRDQDDPAMDTVLADYVRDEFAFKCPADNEGIFEETGSSYFWNSLMNGQRLSNMNFLGLTRDAAGIPLISDKENFHEHIGDGVNILYADGHVQKELQFAVGTGN